MEPNRDAQRVPGVDITLSGSNHSAATTSAATTSSSITSAPLTSASITSTAAASTATTTLATVVSTLTFDEFYRSNRLPIARALALTLANTDLAREAIDEAMARAYQRWDHVSRLDNPGGWVYRVALNWSRSVLRRLTRPVPIWVVSAAHAQAPNIHDPIIDRALDQLTVDQRAVVVCRLMLGWSELHTADSLGIRPGTVKSRLHRALHRLTPLLAPLEEAP